MYLLEYLCNHDLKNNNKVPAAIYNHQYVRTQAQMHTMYVVGRCRGQEGRAMRPCYTASKDRQLHTEELTREFQIPAIHI